jgi:hypothetical protein
MCAGSPDSLLKKKNLYGPTTMTRGTAGLSHAPFLRRGPAPDRVAASEIPVRPTYHAFSCERLHEPAAERHGGCRELSNDATCRRRHAVQVRDARGASAPGQRTAARRLLRGVRRPSSCRRPPYLACRRLGT